MNPEHMTTQPQAATNAQSEAEAEARVAEAALAERKKMLAGEA